MTTTVAPDQKETRQVFSPESALAFLETRIKATGEELQKKREEREAFLAAMHKKMLADVKRETVYPVKERQAARRHLELLDFEIADLISYKHVLENALPDFRNKIQR
jgi:hypothetical protein